MLWTASLQDSLSFTLSQSFLKLVSIESVMPRNHLILCRPLLLPSVFPSIRVFFSELTLYIRWPKYYSLSFSISPSSEYPGLISFRITDLISLLFKGQVFSTAFRKHQFFGAPPSIGPTLISVHDYWKNHSFDYTNLCQKGV